MHSVARSVSICKFLSRRAFEIQTIQLQTISTIRNKRDILECLSNCKQQGFGCQYGLLDSQKKISTTNNALHEATAKKVKPTISALGKLRKQTGYSLSLCKTALQNCDQDLERAKCWLEEQAQAQGWNKANKLEGRNTSQGLIGVCLSSDERAATIVELNSETDFVARNKQFHGLLNQVIAIILEKISRDSDSKLNDLSGEILTIDHLEKEPLATIRTSESQDKTLADLVALNIGQIGENIVLRRAATFAVQSPNKVGKEDVKFAIVTHPSAFPSSDSNNVVYGRFGVIMSYSKDENIGILPEQHTVGESTGAVQTGSGNVH